MGLFGITTRPTGASRCTMKFCDMKAGDVSRSASYRLGWKAAEANRNKDQPFPADDLRKWSWLAGYNDYKITTGG